MLKDFLINFEDPTMRAHPIYKKKKYMVLLVSPTHLAKCGK